MFQDYRAFAYFVIFEFVVIMLLVSAASGVFTSRVLKLRVRGGAIAKDALWGAAGSLTACSSLVRFGPPDHGWFDFSAAIVVAIVLPILHEVYRFKRAGPGKG
jgi:hypothetical protein